MVPLNYSILGAHIAPNLLLEEHDIFFLSLRALTRNFSGGLSGVSVLPLQYLIDFLVHQLVIGMCLIVILVRFNEVHICSKRKRLRVELFLIVLVWDPAVSCRDMVLAMGYFAIVWKI